MSDKATFLTRLLPVKRSSVIGVDLGATAVRAVQLVVRPESVLVARCATVSMRSGGSGEPVGSAVVEAVRRCLRQGEFRGREVSVALNTPQLEYHALELPEASPSELGRIVGFEVERLMRSKSRSVETRHWSLPPTKASAPNALGVAASTDVVTGLRQLCVDAGASCATVDAGAVCLLRMASLLRPWDSQSVWGVLDLAYHTARLVVCSGGVPLLCRDVGAGGRALTMRVASGLGLSESAAEVQKCEHGLPMVNRADDVSEFGTTQRSISGMLIGVLRGDLQEMAGEIKRSYEYILSCYPDRTVAGMVLTGGGSLMRHLGDQLSVMLGILVRRASQFLDEPDCRLRVGPSMVDSLERLALAVGLALDARTLGEKGSP